MWGKVIEHSVSLRHKIDSTSFPCKSSNNPSVILLAFNETMLRFYVNLIVLVISQRFSYNVVFRI